VGDLTGPSRTVRSAEYGPASVELRLAELADSEAIRLIYNREVTESNVTFDLVPRTLQQQQAWLQDRAGVHVAVVAVEDGQVIGFGSLSPYRDRPAYRTTVEDSVYVHRDHQGRGVGRALLSNLVEVATAHGFHAMMARIVGGHEASIALHRAVGFEMVGTEREVGRKFHRWQDVVLMQKLLNR
jgi:L-amino acid N-acyltransferase